MATTTVRRKDKKGRSYSELMDLPVWTAEGYAPPNPGQATNVPAGTRARVEIYAARVLAGEPVFHPGDRNMLPDYETDHATR